MLKCNSCGAEVNQNQDFCANCGAALKAQPSYVQPQPTANPNDTGGFGWGLLGFCIPLVGLILFLVWKQEKPITAKALGLGALIGFILNFISVIIYIVALGGLMAQGGF